MDKQQSTHDLLQNQKQEIRRFDLCFSHDSTPDPKVYLLSKQFIRQWKSYVAYPTEKRNSIFGKPSKPVINQDLILYSDNTILSEDKNSPYHLLTIDNIEQESIVVTPQMMSVFDNYVGKRIVRYKRQQGGTQIVEFNFQQIELIVFSSQTLKYNTVKSLPILKTIISKYADFQELKSQMVKFWIKEYHQKLNLKVQSLQQNKINLWIVEEDVLSIEMQVKYKNILDSEGRLSGSKVTNINNVQDITAFTTNPNIVFLVQVIKKADLGSRQQICIYCMNQHDQHITCFQNEQLRIQQRRIYSLNVNTNEKIQPTGFKNLGNTCYINAVLQIITNTYQLRKYFEEQDLQNEINKNNPLGTAGNLANNLQKIFENKNQATEKDPSDLKKIIEQKNSTFRGNSQQDAQQFLICILDLLNEDLKKPSITSLIKNQEHQSAEQNWIQYLGSNNSVITKLFFGQYSSKLECSNCQKTTISFQPFLNFSLPIPQKQSSIKIVFCGYNRERLYYQIDLYLENFDLKSIVKKLSKELGEQYDSRRLKFLNWKNGFSQVQKLSSEKFLEALLKKQIICYQLSEEESIIINQQNVQKLIFMFKRSNGGKEIPPNRPFWFLKDATAKDIYKRIWNWLYRCSIQHKIQPNLKKQSALTIFAVLFLKSPPLQLSIILRPSGKVAFYYEKPISLNTKIFDSVISLFSKDMKYSIQCNIDKLCQFCDYEMFGKVGTLESQPRIDEQCNLEQCIKNFSVPEDLQGQISCSHCNLKTGIHKTMSLNRVGKYFIIHLKRFRQKFGYRFKNNRYVEFPFDIDLKSFLASKGDSVYTLYGVINHSGTLNSGHYTAYVKMSTEWFLCNDHIIKKVSQDSIQTDNAYILFYKLIE